MEFPFTTWIRAISSIHAIVIRTDRVLTLYISPAQISKDFAPEGSLPSVLESASFFCERATVHNSALGGVAGVEALNRSGFNIM
jgi:hypothetical protein